MLVGIVGLGLIGGSFAKAYSSKGHKVAAFDLDEAVLDFAILSGAAAMKLTDDVIPECDLILICTYPKAAASYLAEKAGLFGPKPVVADCCGTKRIIVDKGMELAEEYGFTYVGAHPMAGTQYSGFSHSMENLYEGAPMAIVPPRYDDPELFDKVKKLFEPAGFSSITVTTADVHDEVVAFTSQLAHVVSSAYIKSPTALNHKGLSAGSYKDMTRVAWLSPEMWSELFLDNSDNLLYEIDQIIHNLEEYRSAIDNGDSKTLISLLDEGRKRKEEVDGNENHSS